MLKKLKYSTFIQTLKDVGLETGSVVHIQSDLRRIGLVDAKADKKAILDFYYSGIREVIGTEGTITVSTAFPDYGRYGTPFIREESPSRLGVFSEFIRKMPGAVRSMHPIISVTGEGPLAREICGGKHLVGMGWDSPWGRLHRLNAKLLSLGLGPDHLGGTSFFHYVDNMFGVPYLYNKLFTAPVFSNGKEVEEPFVMSVRYLNYNILYDSSKVRHILIDRGVLRSTRLGGSYLMSGDTRAIFDHTCELLQDDIYILLKEKPEFTPGKIPMDGNSGASIPPDGDGRPAQIVPMKPKQN